MNRKLVFRVGGLVVAAGVVAAVVVAQQRRSAALPFKASASTAASNDQESDHAKGIDWTNAPLAVPYETPEGATPCETSYLGLKAGEEAAEKNGRHILKMLAPHDDFIARCTQLSPDVQLCMGARYMARHREECRRIRPPQQILDTMFISSHGPEQIPESSGAPSSGPPPSSAPP